MASFKIIQEDLKQAMRQKDAVKLSVLRMLVSSLNNLKIEKKSELEDVDVDRVLKKETKKRLDSIEMYKKAGRDELMKQEEVELQIIKEYLPKEMGKQEVKKLVLEMKEKGELGDNFCSPCLKPNIAFNFTFGRWNIKCKNLIGQGVPFVRVNRREFLQIIYCEV